MTRTTLGLTLGILLVAATTASAQYWLWGRTAVVSSGALLLMDGTFSDRFQVLYVADRNVPATCLVVILDTTTDAFEVAPAAPASCRSAW